VRRNILVTLVGVVLSVAACGGDEDRADTATRQPPTTTDAPTFNPETTVPGSGGFIETPQAKVDEAAKDAPDSFKGEERQIYAQAKAVCGAFSKTVMRKGKPSLTVFRKTLAQGYKGGDRRAALEGCRAGLK
jgi:hypothetical protein